MTRKLTPKAGMAVVAALLLAAVLVAAAPVPARADSAVDTVIIELRVWQRVDNHENVWLSARPKGGRWDALGTVPLPRDGVVGGYSGISRHRFGDLTVGGVAVRVWQRVLEPWRIYVQACANHCAGRAPQGTHAWSPLGMVPLPFGYSTIGGSGGGYVGSADARYRYVDVEIAVPRGNPGLLADREHLLALRDTLAGTATWDWPAERVTLNWAAGTPTTTWEGVTVAGSPPRVTGLDLANSGLIGEIWGYLGDLSELTELRLDGNALTGIIPSKLHLLTKLTHVYLDGNDLQGCVPPRLRTVAHHDLESLGLPDCPAPPDGRKRHLTAGTYYLGRTGPPSNAIVLVFDVSPEQPLSSAGLRSPDEISEFIELPLSIFESNAWGYVLRWYGHFTRAEQPWLFLDYRTRQELERSDYSWCFYDCLRSKRATTQIEQVAASLWVTTTGDDGEWVWP